MAVAVPVLALSGLLSDTPRLVVWAGFCVGWLVSISLVARLT